MLNLGQLVSTVQHNCHISDAQYAGNYTMCTYLLKMREYFRWEHDIPLSRPLPKDEIGSWLVEREQHWEALEDADYEPIIINETAVDPFDSRAINEALNTHGYVYSSGYGIFNKPLFFLGQLHRHEDHGDITMYVSACEYARDLAAPPAMLQGNTIYIRYESLRRSIWERIEEWFWRKDAEHALYYAIKTFGIDLLKDGMPAQARIETMLDHIAEQEINTIVQHELGEAEAGKQLGHEWEEMLLGIAGSKAEFIARSARDHLADCLHTLPWLLKKNNAGLTHYYFSNFSSIRRGIWPELYNAYLHWRNNDDLQSLQDVSQQGVTQWLNACKRMLDNYENGAQQVAASIQQDYASLLA